MKSIDEALDFYKNTKAKIIFATDGENVIGQVEGKYGDLIGMLGRAILALSDNGKIGLEEIGKDLNECVKQLIDSNKEE